MVGLWFSTYLYCGLRLMPLVWMSRSGMPAALMAVMTLSICAALARMAAFASAAGVTTPAEIVATSGTRLDSASAETASKVPSAETIGAGTAAIGATCAQASAASKLADNVIAQRATRKKGLLGSGSWISVRDEQGWFQRVNEP